MQSSNNKVFVVIGILVVFLLLTAGLLCFGICRKLAPDTISQCYEMERKLISGNSMKPLLMHGQEVVLLKGYYACHDPKPGDVVAYDYGGSEVPIIKRIMAKGGDNLAWQGNNLIIDGELMVNSQGKKYTFSKAEMDLINLYIENGRLSATAYLIFGDNVSNAIDSRRFGGVSRDDMLGKFEL